jgi:hypothetical protein
VNGTCAFCGPVEFERRTEDPPPGVTLDAVQARLIFARHEASESHRGMVGLAHSIDTMFDPPPKHDIPEDYA